MTNGFSIIQLINVPNFIKIGEGSLEHLFGLISLWLGFNQLPLINVIPTTSKFLPNHTLLWNAIEFNFFRVGLFYIYYLKLSLLAQNPSKPFRKTVQNLKSKPAVVVPSLRIGSYGPHHHHYCVATKQYKPYFAGLIRITNKKLAELSRNNTNIASDIGNNISNCGWNDYYRVDLQITFSCKKLSSFYLQAFRRR